MAQAEDTWLEGNHVAANCAGIPRIKICEMATIVCPANIMGKWDRPVARTLIQDPKQVPKDPNNTDNLNP